MNRNATNDAKNINTELNKLKTVEDLKDKIQRHIVREFEEDTYVAGMTEEEVDNLAECISSCVQASKIANYTAEKTVDKMYSLKDSRVWKDKLVNVALTVCGVLGAGYLKEKYGIGYKGAVKPSVNNPLPEVGEHVDNPFSDTSFKASPRPSNVYPFDSKAS